MGWCEGKDGEGGMRVGEGRRWGGVGWGEEKRREADGAWGMVDGRENMYHGS
jgi:hypothetical protein